MNKEHKITAIIYDKRGNVLSIGNNSYVKTHPLQARYAAKKGEPYKIYLHAEIHAITKNPFPEKAHRIAIFRYLEDGTPANAKPCHICQHALEVAGIRLVQHT